MLSDQARTMRSISWVSRYFCRILFQMQDDLGAARDALGVLLAGRRDFKPAAARGRPDEDLIRTGAAAGDDDALGHHERRIEADAELADQIGAVLGLGEAGQKGFGAGARDGAEIVDQLLPVHADAAVDDGKRVRLSCSARYGFSAARRRRSVRARRSPHSAACRRRPTRSKSARAGRCRSPNRPSAPSGSKVRQPRPGTAGIRRRWSWSYGAHWQEQAGGKP